MYLVMYLVISTSLNPDSRSRILADAAVVALSKLSDKVTLLDIAELDLPMCDGDSCYEHPDVDRVSKAISAAAGILIAAPVYNYDLSSSTKNVIELTGRAWTDKVVGFLCAAGGRSSYMAPMGLANSLMLDFRSLILPRFIYATGDTFSGPQISDVNCEERIDELARQLVRVAQASQLEI